MQERAGIQTTREREAFDHFIFMEASGDHDIGVRLSMSPKKYTVGFELLSYAYHKELDEIILSRTLNKKLAANNLKFFKFG